MADPFSAWGAEESGPIVGEMFLQKSLLNRLSAQEKAGEIGMMPAKLQLLQAQATHNIGQARHAAAQADQLVVQTAMQKGILNDPEFRALSDLGAGAGPGVEFTPEGELRTPASGASSSSAGSGMPSMAALYAPVQRVLTTSDILFRHGDLKGSREMLGAAGTYLSHLSAANASEARASLFNAERELKDLDIISHELGSVHDEASKFQAGMNIIAKTGKLPANFRGPFSAQWLANAKANALTEKQRIDTAHQARVEANTEAHRRVTEGFERARVALYTRDVKNREAREARLERIGASVPHADLNDLTVVDEILTREAPNLTTESKREIRTPIAIEARRRTQGQRGLMLNEAAREVVNELKKSGRLQVMTSRYGIGDWSYKHDYSEYRPPSTPLKEGQSEFNVGTAYHNDAGDVRVYDPDKYRATGGWGPVLYRR